MEGGLPVGTAASAHGCDDVAAAGDAGGTPTAAEGEPKAQAPPGDPKKSVGHTLRCAAERYALIQLMATQYPIVDLCLVLGVPRSSYYAWCARPPSRLARQNVVLRSKLADLFVANRKVYGSPRLAVC